ncbi:DUF5067 domain-containing protein [Bacillus sp. FSL K6-3431]|uniref:DUF5067 domain-containing protein n=1 Tax=Bacillus sp. FSL K6-3431 TaxID=2921500 RepID=UPI0030F81C82
MSEKVKKPLYKKKRWWIVLIAVMTVFYFIGAAMENAEKEKAEIAEQQRIEKKEEKAKQKAEEKEQKKADEEIAKKEAEQVKKEKAAQEAKKNGEIIKVEDELSFGEFTVNMKQIRVYEENDKEFAEIRFDWLNQAGDGKKMFMSMSLLSVLQGDSVLEETSGAWDVKNKSSSRVYFPNAENGEISVTLTYELADKESPLIIKFKPLNKLIDEDSQEITVDIN